MRYKILDTRDSITIRDAKDNTYKYFFLTMSEKEGWKWKQFKCDAVITLG